MKKNDLLKTENGIFRILSIDTDRVLAIDCINKTMPKFYPASSLSNGEFLDCLPADFPDMEDLSPAHRKVAQERYTMIASAVSVVDDIPKRNLMIEKSAEQFGMSKQSIRSFLCSYLVYQDVAVLAPKQTKEKELTKDQKNMRWALNKFFYTRNQNSLPTAYAMMLKAKYCDEYGVLLPKYPSYNQFRYFYRKHRKMENYYISRDGIKDYQRNNRPLLGDGVQEFAPTIGTAMLDGTTCDIYLVNESGQLVGRPVLVIACDANTSLCLGYSLLWEGGTYSLQTLMLNILEDKVDLCERMGIRITPEQWAVNQLPAVMVTDGGFLVVDATFGAEHTRTNFCNKFLFGILLTMKCSRLNTIKTFAASCAMYTFVCQSAEIFRVGLKEVESRNADYIHCWTVPCAVTVIELQSQTILTVNVVLNEGFGFLNRLVFVVDLGSSWC